MPQKKKRKQKRKDQIKEKKSRTGKAVRLFLMGIFLVRFNPKENDN